MIFSIKNSPETLVQYFILNCTKFLIGREKVIPAASTIEEETDTLTNPFLSQNSPINTQLIEDDFDKSHNIQPEQENIEEKLAQLFFIVGHTAIRFLIYFDNIESYFKRLKNEAETVAQSGKKNTREEELDKISGGVEADIERKIEQLHKIADRFIVHKNLLAQYVPLLKSFLLEIIQKKASVRSPILERTCVLAMCKYMTVSHEFCDKNLNLVFALLKCKVDPITKTNVIVSIGDLIHRFPNLTEPYTNNLYQK
jgi:condensin complex subunit 1